MVIDEIHVNDIGTVFRLTVKDGTSVVDVSGATTKQIIFKNPVTKTNGTQTASFTTDGTDGKIQYVTVSGDIDVVGAWKLQSYFVLSSGWDGRSDVKKFIVHPNL